MFSFSKIKTGRCNTLEIPRAGVVRQTLELVVLLLLGILSIRTFSAEAYVVPTGSMAPTLLGLHRELTCTNCGFVFVVGIDDNGHTGQAICPNCGERGLDQAPSIECGGDRVLVEKLLYEFRRPKRWEVAVFHFPGEPREAYVKRVVGLPGESIRIVRGDVFVDGQIVRKSLAEIRAMRILIHDSRFQGRDAERFPRWLFQCGTRAGPLPSGWRQQDGQFVHARLNGQERQPDDWLVYKHWDPARGRYGPVRDFYGYNGNEPRDFNDINDLGMEARLCVSESVDSISVALRSGSDQFLVRIPVGKPGSIRLLRNDKKASLVNCYNPFEEKGLWPRRVLMEAAVVDRRLQVAIDGRLLFDPYDYDDPATGDRGSESPIALGGSGGAIEVSEVRIYRDIYYTSSLANTPRHSHGMLATVRLGPDEFFVLGDNSPVSNDSRFWSEGPVVPGSMFVGKPLLVHLPGQLVPLKVFGRSVCWVPDPRRIRYIR
jgi:signal peptidase I